MSPNDVLLKLKLHRLLWNMGYFVRREIPVSTYTPSEYTISKRVDITDIDVLGIRFDDDLKPDYIVCECKSGKKEKPLDRNFWLRGVMDYFGARKGYLVVEESGRVPENAGQRLGVTVISHKILLDLQKRYNIADDAWAGSFEPKLDETIKQHKKFLRESFRNQLNYLIYQYWVDPEYFQLKRLMNIGKSISKNFNPANESHKWFVLESSIMLTISLIGLISKLYTTEPMRFTEEVSTQLFGGFLSKKEREDIAKSILKFMQVYIKKEHGGTLPLKVEHLNLDPEYFQKLVELIVRLLNRPKEVRLLPKFMDLICYEFLLKDKPLSENEIRSNMGSYDIYMLAKLSKNIIEFYLDYTSLNKDVFRPLLDF